jgi:hypothetical protein
MSISTPLHLMDQSFVATIERCQLAAPAQGLGVMGIATLAAMNSQNIPEAMQLAMLTE